MTFLLAVVGCPTALMVYVRTPYVTGQGYPVDQPLEFDHRHHVQDDGIDCRYCHSTADRSPYAGIPSVAKCMGCHNQVWNDAPQLEMVWRHYLTGAPLIWKRVHDLPDFVYFDHSAHVTNGIGCETCHGRVDQMARVRQVAPLTMQWCLECHRQPTNELRPPNAVARTGWTPPDDAMASAALQDQLQVESQTHCTSCHR